MSEQPGVTPKAGIFDGIRVIDLSHILAGPSSTMHMADMGAEVIKVERPPTGDGTRVMAGMKNGVNPLFAYRNRGKKSISLDLRRPEALEIVKSLVKVSDIVVQNRRVGAMDRLGIGYEDLKKINPRIIMVSISGYGQNGPMAEWPANDLNIQAQSGIMAVNGHPDGPPLPCWVSWVDSATGTHTFAAVSAALFHRERTGIGQHIDISMMDLAFSYHDFPILEYLWTDGKVQRTRSGPNHPTVAPQGVWECKDGYVVASPSTDASWRQLTELMGRPELATDPRFDSQHHRTDNRVEANRIMAEWIKGFDMADAKIIMEENGVAATPILSIEEVVNHPQLEAREMLVEVDDPRAGRIKLPNSAFRFSDTKASARGRPPLLGEHNEEVLTNLLGYSKEQVAQLREQGVIYAEQAVAMLADS